MRKKLIHLLLTLTLSFPLFSFIGCDFTSSDTQGSSTASEDRWGTVFTMQTAYAKAQTLGYDGTLEEFIKSISGTDGSNGKDGANGTDGVGIVNISLNANGELVVTLSIGEPINLGKIKGDKGEVGVGILSIEKIDTENLTDTYKISYSDGHSTTFTLTNGANGQNGVSITDATVNTDGELVLTFSEGNPMNLGKIVGQDGAKGNDGVSIVGATLSSAGVLSLTLSNGESITVGNIKGQKGEDGVSVSKTEINANGELVMTFSNGTSTNLGNVIGAKGEDGENGKSAYELYKEVYGYTGTEKEWLADLVNGNLAFKDTYTVRFETGCDATIPSQQVYDGKKATCPTTPTKAGYTFEGWYYGEERWSFVGYTVTQDITLTAKWEVRYSKDLQYELSEDGTSYTVKGLGLCTDSEIIIPSTYLNLPVTSIALNAFACQTDLTSITIPSSVREIGNYAFEGCTNLNRITFETTNGWYTCWSYPWNCGGCGEDFSIDVSDPVQNAARLCNSFDCYMLIL